VISTETRLVCSSRPLPQAPLTGLAEASRVFSSVALSQEELSPAPPWPGAGPLPPGAVSPA
jgi:hypothetical protein